MQASLKDIPSQYGDKVEIGNDGDKEYSWSLPNTVELPIMVNWTGSAGQAGYDKRFKTQELLDGFKKYTDEDSYFYKGAGTNVRVKIRDIPCNCFGNEEKNGDKGHSVSYFPNEKKLTQYLRDANKLFVKDGYGKVTSQELDLIEPYEILIKKDKMNGLEKDSKLLFNRLRNVEKATRLREYIGAITEEMKREVKAKLKLVLDLEDD